MARRTPPVHGCLSPAEDRAVVAEQARVIGGWRDRVIGEPLQERTGDRVANDGVVEGALSIAVDATNVYWLNTDAGTLMKLAK